MSWKIGVPLFLLFGVLNFALTPGECRQTSLANFVAYMATFGAGFVCALMSVRNDLPKSENT